MSRRLAFVLKALLSFTLLVWMVTRANLLEVLEVFTHAHLGWLFLAACLPAIGLFLTSVRWGGLLRAQNLRFPTHSLLQSCFVAKFVGQFLPTTIAGDAVRAYDTWKAGASKSVAVASLVVDRLVGLVVLVLFGVVALCFPHELTQRFPAITTWVGIGAAALLACLWIVFAPSGRLIDGIESLIARLPKQVRPRLQQVSAAFSCYRGHGKALLEALFVSVLLQANVVTFYYFLGQAIGLEISYGVYYLLVPIAVFVMLAPISINGIGVRESIFVFLLGTLGIEDARAVAFAWLEHATLILYGIIGGIIYVLRKSSSAEYDQVSTYSLEELESFEESPDAMSNHQPTLLDLGCKDEQADRYVEQTTQ